jgi:hypothetical protein
MHQHAPLQSLPRYLLALHQLSQRAQALRHHRDGSAVVEVDGAGERERRRGGGSPDAVVAVGGLSSHRAAPAEEGGSPDAVVAVGGLSSHRTAPAEEGGESGRGSSGGLST